MGVPGTLPLPKDHWLFKPDRERPPAYWRTGTKDPMRRRLEKAIRAGAQYGIRAATDNGRIDDYDPDAMVQNIIIGMLGYWTPDGTRRTSSCRVAVAQAKATRATPDTPGRQS